MKPPPPWAAWSARFAAMARREKWLVLFLAVVGLGWAGFHFGVDPWLQRAAMAEKSARQARAEMQAMLPQIVLISQADPDAPQRARLAQLKQQQAAIEQRLARFQSGMVSPERMPAFLEGVLRQNRKLEIVALKTLPAEALGLSGDTAAGTKKVPSGSGIYQHGIELTVAGSYSDLQAYLGELERLPQRVMWNRLSLKADNHPRNLLTLRIYTLSFDENWLTL